MYDVITSEISRETKVFVSIQFALSNATTNEPIIDGQHVKVAFLDKIFVSKRILRPQTPFIRLRINLDAQNTTDGKPTDVSSSY